MRAPSKNRTRGVAFATSVVTSALFVASPSLAAPPRLDTTAAGTTCPAADALRKAIAAQLGRDDFDRERAPDVLVRIRSNEGGLAADVIVTSRDGAVSSRMLEGAAEGCEALVRAAALSVALAIEEEAARAKPTPPPPPPPPPAAPPPRDAVTTATPPPRERAAVTANALSALGLQPRASAGAGASARVRIGDATFVSARGFHLPGAAMPNDAFSLRLVAGGAGACVEPASSRIASVFGCAHAMFGSWDVTEASVPMQGRTAAFYAAASVAAGARAKVAGPVHVEAVVDGQVPLTRPTFLTAPCPPTGFEPPFIALALWVGAGVSIF